MESLTEAVLGAENETDPFLYMRKMKSAVIESIAELDSSVFIEDTHYFNHSAVPDLLLKWRDGRGERPVYLRRSVLEVEAAQDVRRLAASTLHEAWPYDSAITQALPDYRMHEASGGFKADDNIILTRRDKAPAGRFAALRMKLRWTGPKSPRRLNQPPRTWPVLDIGFRKWRVVSLHNPTRGNEKARDEGFGRLVRLAKQRGSKRRGLLIAGDFNGDPRPLAKAIGGEVVKGYYVDHAVVRGATGKRVAVLDKHGSDHPPVLYRFTRD